MSLAIETVKIEPQIIGLIDPKARCAALQDERSVSYDGVPVLVPIEYATEMNQTYFKDNTAYYFSPLADDVLAEASDDQPLLEQIRAVAHGSSIAVEYNASKPDTLDQLKAITMRAGTNLTLDPKCLDSHDASMAAVQHFYSEYEAVNESSRTEATINAAYAKIVENGEWQEEADIGIQFASGEDIDEELTEKLWTAYNRTFDGLVENHPSAQKQPREYFEEQLLTPVSKVVYIAQPCGAIATVAFCLENTDQCGWLQPEYFKEINPTGITAFFPGIATALDENGKQLKGTIANSPKLIRALSHILANTTTISGIATQCTNRSEAYIPKSMNRFSKSYLSLNLRPTSRYLYPVYLMD